MEKFLKDKYPLIFVLFVAMVLIIGPFLISNNLEGFDTAGQFASVYYIKTVFWPWPSGWNTMFLGGFPQGLLYPSFFHWLSAALSFVLPIKLAYKLLLSAAIFLFPVSYYLFSKSVLKNNLMANAAVVFVSIFYFFDLGLNDNLFADLYFGMAPHLFSLTAFIGYLYFLHKLSKESKQWFWAGLFLSLCVVSHVFTGMAAVAFGLILWILNYKNKSVSKDLFKQFVLGAILSSWWWLPFLINIGYVSGSDNGSVVSPVLILFMPVIFIINAVSFFSKENNNDFIKTISIFSSLIFIFFLIGRLADINGFPIHFSRFLVYSLFLTPILIIHVLSRKIDWQKVNLAFIFIFGFYFFFFKITPVGPFDTFLLDKVEQYYQNGRVIVTGGSRFLDDRFHITRVKLAIEKNMADSEGLFVESSLNGWFVMSMMKSWENTVPTFVWAYMDLKDVADLRWGTQLFGVNYEYRINDSKPSTEDENLQEMKGRSLLPIGEVNKEKKEAIKKEENNLKFKLEKKRLLDDEHLMSVFAGEQTPFYYQSFYQINNVGLAEALDIRPVDINNDWREKTIKWWSTNWLTSSTSKEYIKPVLVFRKSTRDWNLADKRTSLSLKEIGNKMNEFTVDATSYKEAVPIYVKVGYFPFWHAYNDKGEELQIYKTSPNFMLVYSRGLITFKYIEPWYYYFGFLVSGLGLLFVLYKIVLSFLKAK